MGTFVNILLDILSILAIIVLGAFVVVVIADLILFLIDGREGIFFRKGKKDESSKKEKETETKSITKEDIVVYSNQTNPNSEQFVTKQEEVIDGNKVQEIDYDKAVQEQQMLQASRKPSLEPVQKQSVKESAPEKEDIFWDNDDEDEFNAILNEVVKEAKKTDESVEKEIKLEEKIEKVEPKVDETIQSETQKELEELRALKEQQQKEIEEFKQMKEDFAREKEEQLALMKENLDKAKAEEIEKIKQEILKEQEKIEEMQVELEAEKAEPVVVEEDVEPIVKETIIKDEEEINKLRYKNLMRMNNRLTRIIRDTEKLQIQKQRAMEKQQAEKEKLLAKEEQEKLREQQKIIEVQKANHERLVKQQEALQRKFEISKKLNEVSKKAGKYKLNSASVKVVKETIPEVVVEDKVKEEVVDTKNTTIVEKTPVKSSQKPTFDKEYYEARILELEEEMKEAEKELRQNKSEFVPLTRIHKAYARDSEKLRKKELQVAKQKVALYGVNTTKVDPSKKEKLDENLKALAELKDSVEHCEEVIAKNKDRYPVLEKNNKLILKHIDRINEEMKVCNKAISYYNKNNK